jgi:Tfp pilus assembly protein PilZ
MSSDKRKHQRLSQEVTIFIELASAGLGDDDAKIALCQSVNISHSGLRVRLNHELIVGAILQIGVELPHAEDTLYLAAQVIWCKRDDQADYAWSAGLKLMNANDSDIETWRTVLGEMNNLHD